jgi:hypothetical protein
VRALLPLVEEQDAEQVRPIRDALAQLQLAYARLAGTGGEEGGSPGDEQAPGTGAPQEPPAPGGERPPGRGGLWVPPGSA